nr:hypothetical protein [Mycobacterium tuberculosis]
MTSSHLIDAEQLLADQLAQASPDLLRGLLSTFIAALMGAEPGRDRPRWWVMRTGAPDDRRPYGRGGRAGPD